MSLCKGSGEKLNTYILKHILSFHKEKAKQYFHCVRAEFLSRVSLFATPWTVAHQTPLSI